MQAAGIDPNKLVQAQAQAQINRQFTPEQLASLTPQQQQQLLARHQLMVMQQMSGGMGANSVRAMPVRAQMAQNPTLANSLQLLQQMAISGHLPAGVNAATLNNLGINLNNLGNMNATNMNMPSHTLGLQQVGTPGPSGNSDTSTGSTAAASAAAATATSLSTLNALNAINAQNNLNSNSNLIQSAVAAPRPMRSPLNEQLQAMVRNGQHHLLYAQFQNTLQNYQQQLNSGNLDDQQTAALSQKLQAQKQQYEKFKITFYEPALKEEQRMLAAGLIPGASGVNNGTANTSGTSDGRTGLQPSSGNAVVANASNLAANILQQAQALQAAGFNPQSAASGNINNLAGVNPAVLARLQQQFAQKQQQQQQLQQLLAQQRGLMPQGSNNMLPGESFTLRRVGNGVSYSSIPAFAFNDAT